MGSKFTEKIFTGTLPRQLNSALNYLNDVVVKEKVIKSNLKAEADRFFNYPYDALDEAICNAVYHRGYDDDSTIEVRIYPSQIDIISFPGPLPPLDRERLKNQQFVVRKYRNRRIGEFLKELHLTEGRSTGIPTIINALKKNESPPPVFETDEDRTYFKTTFHIHPLFKEVKESLQIIVRISEQANFFMVQNLDEILDSFNTYGEPVRVIVREQIYTSVSESKIKKLIHILKFCSAGRNASSILSEFGVSNQTKNFNNYIALFLDYGLLERTIPEKPTSPLQLYRTSVKGKTLLQMLHV